MSERPVLSVIIAAHNPHTGRLARVAAGLRAQTLPTSTWEIVVVDNASSDRTAFSSVDFSWHPSVRIIHETQLGLTPARLRGIFSASGELFVFVDDDNVLATDYLAAAVRRLVDNPRLGVAGGPVVPEFETPPAPWTSEFFGLLALHEHGPDPLIARGAPHASWPKFAPVGAGLCMRRTAAARYLDAIGRDPARRQLDRSGSSLASGGDNDLVFTALHDGWDVGYFPELQITHLIPPRRLEAEYLARLNASTQRSWVRVLALHGHCPWPAVAPWSVPFRSARAWWRERAWRTPAHRIRWRARVGRFQGQADLHRERPAK